PTRRSSDLGALFGYLFRGGLRMDPKILREIEAIFPEDRILTGLGDRYTYGFDASFGQYLPELVVQPQTVEQIARLVRLANEHLIPLYPRGSATSLILQLQIVDLLHILSNKRERFGRNSIDARSP